MSGANEQKTIEIGYSYDQQVRLAINGLSKQENLFEGITFEKQQHQVEFLHRNYKLTQKDKKDIRERQKAWLGVIKNALELPAAKTVLDKLLKNRPEELSDKEKAYCLVQGYRHSVKLACQGVLYDDYDDSKNNWKFFLNKIGVVTEELDREILKKIINGEEEEDEKYTNFQNILKLIPQTITKSFNENKVTASNIGIHTAHSRNFFKKPMEGLANAWRVEVNNKRKEKTYYRVGSVVQYDQCKIKENHVQVYKNTVENVEELSKKIAEGRSSAESKNSSFLMVRLVSPIQGMLSFVDGGGYSKDVFELERLAYFKQNLGKPIAERSIYFCLGVNNFNSVETAWQRASNKRAFVELAAQLGLFEEKKSELSEDEESDLYEEEKSDLSEDEESDLYEEEKSDLQRLINAEAGLANVSLEDKEKCCFFDLRFGAEYKKIKGKLQGDLTPEQYIFRECFRLYDSGDYNTTKYNGQLQALLVVLAMHTQGKRVSPGEAKQIIDAVFGCKSDIDRAAFVDEWVHVWDKFLDTHGNIFKENPVADILNNTEYVSELKKYSKEYQESGLSAELSHADNGSLGGKDGGHIGYHSEYLGAHSAMSKGSACKVSYGVTDIALKVVSVFWPVCLVLAVSALALYAVYYTLKFPLQPTKPADGARAIWAGFDAACKSMAGALRGGKNHPLQIAEENIAPLAP